VEVKPLELLLLLRQEAVGEVRQLKPLELLRQLLLRQEAALGGKELPRQEAEVLLVRLDVVLRQR